MTVKAALRRDRGSMTVLAAGICGVLTIVLVAGLALTSAALAAHRARAAADLAALSAAARVQGGASRDEACTAAAAVASRNAASLVACALSNDGAARVETSSPVALVVPGLGHVATARARAGPGSPNDLGAGGHRDNR